MNSNVVNFSSAVYKSFIKPVFFSFDPELVHNRMTTFGESLGKYEFTKKILANTFRVSDKSLTQTIAGLKFESPLGLAAGFDYEAKLTQITPSLGFGFQSVGTITNKPYAGNPTPRLGRLPKSKSLMVNKGFKNAGATAIINKLSQLHFSIPVGISIGRTNSKDLSQKESVRDIINTFIAFEQSKVGHAYYELNISCPNLYGNVSFYTPQNLAELLEEIQKLGIKRPLFIKMPIEKTNEEVLDILHTAEQFNVIKGVIIGNLQKNREDKAFVKKEVQKFSVGNFSGKPTFQRSNELIALSYYHFKNRFIIIGCGGVFTPQDAYRKILLGSSLVQLITGMIYQGPQLICEINSGLAALLKRDGFKNIKDAVGIANR